MEYKMFFLYFSLASCQVAWPGVLNLPLHPFIFFISTLTNIFHLLAVFLKFFFNRINILLNLLAVLLKYFYSYQRSLLYAGSILKVFNIINNLFHL